jgi:hypothetical protein
LQSNEGDITIAATEANIISGESMYLNESGSKTVSAGVSYGNNEFGK